MPYEFHLQTPVVTNDACPCIRCRLPTTEAVVYQHQLFSFHHAHLDELTVTARLDLLRLVAADRQLSAALAA